MGKSQRQGARGSGASRVARGISLQGLPVGGPFAALAAGLAVVATVSPAMASPVLAPIWGNDAVIQRDRPVVIGGTAAPGEQVTVTLGESSAKVRAARDGRFSVRLPARPASASPLVLAASGADGKGVRFEGLVVGEVWLCSGQSNMELTVDRALDAWNQTQAAGDDLLRMITIPKAVSDAPQAGFGGAVAWQRTDSRTVPAFSAACYYMARDLRRRLGVPVGAIHASWGGSASRAWIDPAGGGAIYGGAEMALLQRYGRDPAGAVAAFAPRWESWYAQASGGGRPWAEPETLAWRAVPSMGAWNRWTGSGLDAQPVGNVWLRRTVVLSAAQASGAATLSLGGLDDMDMTWVNGRAVGNSYGWDNRRDYPVPAGVLREGANDVVILVTNTWGDGGFVGGTERYALAAADGSRVAIADGWRYAPAPVREVPPRAPWDRQAGIGVMANAMIAPIGPLPLAGVAWYQGESDVGVPGYAERLRALFAGWRAQFGSEARMLVVQLANYGAPQKAPAASGWADLREAQREAVLADRNAALVTAIDVGERTDIHPANKNALGLRLAAAATGEALPQPLSARREGSVVRVRFAGVEGGLSAWSGPFALGFELCGATQESCRFVAGQVEGDSVVLADAAGATRVRYGWADSPVLNTYDARPMALPGFELPLGDAPSGQ